MNPAPPVTSTWPGKGRPSAPERDRGVPAILEEAKQTEEEQRERAHALRARWTPCRGNHVEGRTRPRGPPLRLIAGESRVPATTRERVSRHARAADPTGTMDLGRRFRCHDLHFPSRTAVLRLLGRTRFEDERPDESSTTSTASQATAPPRWHRPPSPFAATRHASANPLSRHATARKVSLAVHSLPFTVVSVSPRAAPPLAQPPPSPASPR